MKQKNRGKIFLPIKLPITFSHQQSFIRLPIKLPMSFKQRETQRGVILPIRLPMTFKDYEIFDRKEKFWSVSSSVIENKPPLIYPISCYPQGSVKTFPISEKVWIFPGLLISENIVQKQSATFQIDERIQNKIYLNFELIDKENLKISWSGQKLPRVEILLKNTEDQPYKVVDTYSWAKGSAIVKVSEDNYYIKVVGSKESGVSAEYLLSKTNEIELIGQLNMIDPASKVHNVDIGYIQEYNIDINY